jgi:hypothetical protein
MPATWLHNWIKESYKMSKPSEKPSAPASYQGYQAKMSRRDSLRWLGLLSASVVMPNITACSHYVSKISGDTAGHWPDLQLKPITSYGYGKDPNLIIAPSNAWPRILNQTQLALLACLADWLVPRDGEVPSASEVAVPEVIDEWMSAPYPRQQEDSMAFLHGFAWIDDEAKLRFGKIFVDLSEPQQRAILDDIAYDNDVTPPQFKRIAQVFSRLRKLVLAAFFCSPQGSKDLGYMGNVAIVGDYPGPTPEALAHLDKVLIKLQLS